MHEEKILQKEESQASPAARKMAHESKVDLSSVRGTGKNGSNFKRRCHEFNGIKASTS